MNCPNLEDVACKNLNILIEIYKYLEFKDQIRLALTTHWLQEIFVCYIWPHNYHNIEISFIAVNGQTPLVMGNGKIHGYFSLINNLKEKEEQIQQQLYFNSREFSEFLSLYGHQVTEVTIKNFNDGSFKTVAEQEIVTDYYLDTIIKYFVNLEYLQFYSYVFISRIIDTACQLAKNGRDLKCLSLKADGCTLDYTTFCDILQGLKHLECLTIDSEILTPATSLIELPTPERLEKLHLSAPSMKFLLWHLNIFENLLDLSLNLAYNLFEQSDWDSFCRAAKRLEILKLEDLFHMKPMEHFNLPDTLKELHIIGWTDFTGNNLNQIFLLPNLRKFSSKKTEYKNWDLFNFNLPACLEALDCEDISTADFKKSYKNHKHLRELSWYDYSTDINFNDGLSTCQALSCLSIEEGWLPMASVMQIPNLTKLNLSEATLLPLQWPELIELLKYPPLRELQLDCDIAYDYDEENELLLKGFATKLTSLSLKTTTFCVYALDFWLDLFSQSISNLKITFDLMTTDLLKDIIDNEYFPKQLKSIHIWGLEIACKDLKQNFDEVMYKMPDELQSKISSLILYRKKVKPQ